MTNTADSTGVLDLGTASRPAYKNGGGVMSRSHVVKELGDLVGVLKEVCEESPAMLMRDVMQADTFVIYEIRHLKLKGSMELNHVFRKAKIYDANNQRKTVRQYVDYLEKLMGSQGGTH